MEHTQLTVYNCVSTGSLRQQNQGWQSFIFFFSFILLNTFKFIYSCNKKILLFNVTGDRNPNEMLKLISENVQFDEALFTPNISSLCTQAKGRPHF